MNAEFFLAFVATVLALVLAGIARYARRAAPLSIALVAWLAYVGALSWFGVVRNATMRPPGVAFLFVPAVVLLTVFLARASRARSPAAPLWILLGAQVFRVGVELFIHRLWIEGLAPRMLTFAGANVDIYVGASAPLIAWLSTRGRVGRRVALAWNGLGLLALANVVARAVLTTPGPLNLVRAEVPNAMIGTFPYTFIPGFFVPLAVALHVLAIRAITSRPPASRSAA